MSTTRARRRLIPFLFLLYVVAYLDRINVGFAALQMNRALGLSATAYGLGAGIFFLSYVTFEIPSNLILARVGARLWIARIMITWGIVSAAMMFVRGAAGFYALRFLLGAAEAGFFPGIIYYLTQWFPARERARTIAAFMTATLAAGIVGGPISGALLSLDGARGLAGWQWLFLLEGVPAIVLGVAVFWLLPDGPADARWLAPADRAAIVAALEAEHGVTPRGHTLGDALRTPAVWILAVVYFAIPISLYTFGFWLPPIVKAASAGSDLAVGVLSAIPYAVATVVMIVVARHSDRTGERRWHIAAAAVVGGASLAVAGHAGTLVPAIVILSIAMAGLASMFGPFWTLATDYVSGVGAAGAIALINSAGNVGGFVGPYLVGYVHDRTNSFAAGLAVVGAILAAGGLLVLAVPAREPKVDWREATIRPAGAAPIDEYERQPAAKRPGDRIR